MIVSWATAIAANKKTSRPLKSTRENVMIQTYGFRTVAVTILIGLALTGQAQTQEDYGYTEFEASGSPEAHQVF